MIYLLSVVVKQPNARHHPLARGTATAKFTMRAALIRVGCMPLLDRAPRLNLRVDPIILSPFKHQVVLHDLPVQVGD